MRVLESISAGKALAISFVTGGPSVAYAAVQDEWMPVAVGVAVGTITFLWSLARSNNDQRFDALIHRLDEAEREIDRHRADAKAAKEDAARLSVELAGVKAQLELKVSASA